MRAIVTGHSGFLGSWLTTLLVSSGIEVHGYANHGAGHYPFSLIDTSDLLVGQTIGDIRDVPKFTKALRQVKPDAVIHLAAEPIVQSAHNRPEDALSVNAFGTLTVLEALASTEYNGVFLSSTTDKVYSPRRLLGNPFIESDVLGGTEPYSSSKVLADMAVSTYATSLGTEGWNVFRAGNLIGGGDRGLGRLMPSVWAAIIDKESLEVRNPASTRPWQHVLDCALGILKLLLHAKQTGCSEAWNFGPPIKARQKTVTDFLDVVSAAQPEFAWFEGTGQVALNETQTLELDSGKAHRSLGWEARLELNAIVKLTLEWEAQVLRGESLLKITQRQVDDFLGLRENSEHL